MKKYTFFSLLASLLVFVSCDLTLLPENETTPDRYFRNEDQLALWTNQFYTSLEEAGFGSTSDIMISNGLSAYVTGSRSAATQSWSFTQLRKINYLLEHIHACSDKAAVTKYSAVARFFRAYFYGVRTRTYGDLPWYDKVLSSDDPDLYKPRDSRTLVMDHVLEDYRYAADNLPEIWDATYNTKVTRWAALAFASRDALYEGTFRKYHGIEGAERYLEAAAEFAEEFIDNAPFTLYSAGSEPYRELFYSEDAKTQEVVLARRYDLGYAIAHSLGNNVRFSRISLTKNFMNHYLMSDGSYFSSQEGWQTMTYIEEVRGRDARMSQTVLCPGYIQVGETAVTPNTLYAHTGYSPIKYVGNAASCSSGTGSSDYPLMRAAEVYLNFAEAKAELGTLSQSDLDKSINKIRTRAGLPGLRLSEANGNPDPFLEGYYTKVTGPNKGVILEIRRERTVEMVLEQRRSWDLFRWAECPLALNLFHPYYGCYFPGEGTYDMDQDGVPDLELYLESPSSSCATKLKIGTDVVFSNTTYGYITGYPDTIWGAQWDDAKDYLWPIPAAQRVLNHNLTQNPGWEDGLGF